MVSLRKYRLIILGLLILIFFVCGGLVDYWQSAMEHQKYIYSYLKDYFVFFWLVFYTGLLPFLMVFVASDYDRKIAKLYLAMFLWGGVMWDIVYSLNNSGYIVTEIKDYLYLRGGYLGLSMNQIIVWHVTRIVLGLVIVINTVRIKNKKWIS